jgi:putative restriction endonuclease
MDPEEFLERLRNLKLHSKGGTYAPHKPLVLLYFLKLLERSRERLVPYSEVEDELEKLIIEFGPWNVGNSHYPFYRLCTDGIWEVHGIDPDKDLTSSGDVHKTALRNGGRGGFTKPIWNLLKDSQPLKVQSTCILLQSYFSISLSEDIVQSIGLDLKAPTNLRIIQDSTRDPKFREDVLRAYGRRCAVCNYDLRIDDSLFGLEAAHIRWHAYQGPDIVKNGLALCTFHHKAFDRGAFTINDSMKIVVSEHFSGQSPLSTELLIKYHQQEINHAIRQEYLPADEFVVWHAKNIFRRPART